MHTSQLQTGNIRQVLRTLGVSPRKALGQHFLVDAHILHRVVEAAELAPGDTVVEVGPGLGILTRALAARAGRVIALEMDGELSQSLARNLRDHPNVELVTADAREIDLGQLFPGEVPYKLVANLPYYAANPIIRHFLEASQKPQVMVVMVQKEVAQSMAAAPGHMSLLSVGVQFYGRPRLLFTVPPSAFYPPPKVSSGVVRIEVFDKPEVQVSSTEHFFAVVRAGFRAPRKQLRGSLRLALDRDPEEVTRWLAEAGVDPTRRAETLTLEEWAALARAAPV